MASTRRYQEVVIEPVNHQGVLVHALPTIDLRGIDDAPPTLPGTRLYRLLGEKNLNSILPGNRSI